MNSQRISFVKNIMDDKCKFTTLYGLGIEENDPSSPSVTILSCFCDKAQYVAIGKYCLLNIYDLSSFKTDSSKKKQELEMPSYELEFDHPIECLCWDDDGFCLIVGDQSGTLHFVSNTGAVLFSHCILPRGQKSAFLSISMLRLFTPDKSIQGKYSTLIAVLDSGLVVGIENIPVDIVIKTANTNPQALATAMQTFPFFRFSLPIQPIQKAMAFVPHVSNNITKNNITTVEVSVASASDSSQLETHAFSILALDIQQRLHIFEISCSLPHRYTSTACITVPFASGHGSASPCIDAALLSIGDSIGKKILSLQKDGTLSILDSKTGDVLVSITVGPTVHKLLLASAGVILPIDESRQSSHIDADLCKSNKSWFGVVVVADELSPKTLTTLTITGLDAYCRLLVLAEDNVSNLKYTSIGRGSSANIGALMLETVVTAASPTKSPAKTSSNTSDAPTYRPLGHVCALEEGLLDVAEGLCHGMAVEPLEDEGGGYDTSSPLINPPPTDSLVAYLIGLLLRPRNQEGSLLYVLESLSSLSAPGEVMAVLKAMVAIPLLPHGFLNKALKTTEVVLDSLGLNYGNVSPEVTSTLVEYFRCLDTASEMSWCPPSFVSRSLAESENDAPILGPEILGYEKIRLRFLWLTGLGGVEESWCKCVTSGYLRDSSLLLNRHMGATLPKHVVRALKSVPTSVTVEDIAVWFEDGLRGAIVSAATSNPNAVLAAGQVVQELCRRARLLEANEHHPFNALILASLARDLANSTQFSNLGGLSSTNGTGKSNDSLKLYESLTIQAAIRKRWGVTYALETISSLGVEGFIWDILWDIDEEKFIEEIHGNIIPFTREFKSNLDSILFSWLSNGITTKLIVNPKNEGTPIQSTGEYEINSTQALKSNDLDTCTLSRLVTGVRMIVNHQVKTKGVLLLLQLPDFDQYRDVKVKNNNNQQQQHQLETNDSFTSISSGNNSSMSSPVSLLISMAKELVQVVETSQKEALTEAIRMHKLRTIAAEYQITGIDVRDSRQIRAAVYLIASRTQKPNSIQDALDFASSWTVSSIDLCAMFTRAILVRGMDKSASVEEMDVMGRSKSIRDVLNIISKEKISRVVDDVMTTLMGTLEDLCTSSGEDASPGELSSDEDEQDAELICQTAITIISWYLDERKAGVDSKSMSSLIQNEPLINPLHTKTTSWMSKEDPKEVMWINPELLSQFKRLLSLQHEVEVYLSISQLKDTSLCRVVATSLAETRAKEILNNSQIMNPKSTTNTTVLDESTFSTSLRRACALLNVSPSIITHVLMRAFLASGSMEMSMKFAQVLGQERSVYIRTGPSSRSLNSISSDNNDETNLLIDAAVSLCAAVAKQSVPGLAGNKKLPLGTRAAPTAPVHIGSTVASFNLSRELLESASTCAPPSSLPKVLDLLSSCNSVLAVQERLEGHDRRVLMSSSSGSSNNKFSSTGSVSGQPAGPVPDTENIQPSRNKVTAGTATASSVEKSSSKSGGVPGTSASTGLRISETEFYRDGILMSSASVLPCLMKFINKEAQRRVIGKASTSSSQAVEVSSIHASPQNHMDIDELVSVLQKSENHILAIHIMLGSWHSSNTKSQCLRTSYLSLGRKILSYREIDSQYAVACLSAVPYEAMVRELKSAVPSIQSDFSRLRTVAMIGEQLAHMWRMEELLLVFQSLQTNARWWHILSSYGVKIDPRAFQSSISSQREACIKAVVPELLQQSDMNLSLTIEYCEQFDLEPSIAAVHFIENLLTRPPTQPGDMTWVNPLQRAATRISETILVTNLREILPKVHSVDYEKIQYVCSWLIQLLSDGPDNDDVTCDDNLSVSSVAMNHGKDEESVNDYSVVSDTSMTSTVLVEIDNYRRYIDICSFLSSISFPTEATSQISSSRVKGEGSDLISLEDLNTAYHGRLPFWVLLQDPWKVIDPVMEVSPETASKLAPLCKALRIDRDPFFSRRAMSLYNRSRSLVKEQSQAHQILNTSTLSSMMIGSPFEVLQEAIQFVISPLQRVEVWKWVFGRERGSDDRLALQSLDNAFDCLRETSEKTKSEDPYRTLKNELEMESKRLKLEIAIRQIPILTSSTPLQLPLDPTSCLFIQTIPAQFASLLGDPSQLLRKIMENSIEISWNFQLQYICFMSDILNVTDICKIPICPAIVSYLQYIGRAMDEISKQIPSVNNNTSAGADGSDMRLDKGTDSGLAKLQFQSQSQSQSALENIRNHIMGKLLADTDKSVNNGHNAQSSSNKGGADWLWSGSSQTALKPTPAELRRREDLYFGMALAAVLISCTQETLRAYYTIQLEDVARGRAAKSLRRLSSRSRLRALFALLQLPSHFLSSQSIISSSKIATISSQSSGGNGEAHGTRGNTVNPQQSLRSFLYCLADMNHIRLACTESTLAAALGFDVSMSTMTSTQTEIHEDRSSTSASSLVRTWLHDEGHHSEVSELCRDVLISTNSHDLTIWTLLLDHMERCGYVRAQLSALLSLRNLPVFVSLCRTSLSSQFMRVIATSLREIVEKLQQMFELLRSHVISTEAISSIAHESDMDDISVSEFGDGSIDLDTVSHVGSVRGKVAASIATASVMGPRSAQLADELRDKEVEVRSKRILLVPKCRVRSEISKAVCHVSEQRDPPEDLLQTLRDTATVFQYLIRVLSMDDLRNGSVDMDLHSIWSSCLQLLSLSANISALGIHNESQINGDWGGSIECLLMTQVEINGLKLLSSGAVCVPKSTVLDDIFSSFHGYNDHGDSIGAMWRAFAALCDEKTSYEFDFHDLDRLFDGFSSMKPPGVFLKYSPSKAVTAQGLASWTGSPVIGQTETVLCGFLDRGARTWHESQTHRRALKTIFEWAHSSESRWEQYRKAYGGISVALQSSVGLALEVIYAAGNKGRKESFEN